MLPALAALLLAGAAVWAAEPAEPAEPAVPSGPDDLEFAAEQAQQRLDLRRRQAEAQSRSRHEGRVASEADAARQREHFAVERMRQQSRHEEQRQQRMLRRPGILPRGDDVHGAR